MGGIVWLWKVTVLTWFCQEQNSTCVLSFGPSVFDLPAPRAKLPLQSLTGAILIRARLTTDMAGPCLPLHHIPAMHLSAYLKRFQPSKLCCTVEQGLGGGKRQSRLEKEKAAAAAVPRQVPSFMRSTSSFDQMKHQVRLELACIHHVKVRLVNDKDWLHNDNRIRFMPQRGPP